MMIRRTLLFASIFFFIPYNAITQADQKDTIPHIVFSGYIDAYYGFYTDSVGAANYQKFPSVCPRDGFGLNTAMITAQYDGRQVRGTIALHYGDIPRSTWSAGFNPVMEAHLGVKLSKKIWVDAGFFRTHLGTEGLLPKENIASSIAIPTYFEPYYECGVRLNYNPSDKLAINLFAMNGYNMFEDNNRKKSFGLLATYAFSTNGNIGYSNYIGDDTPEGADSISHLRIHQNIFFNYQKGKLKYQVGGDFCWQQNAFIFKNEPASMYSGLASVKYQVKAKSAIYARGEFLNDAQGFMTGVFIDKANVYTGLKLWGATVGYEYCPTEKSYVRLEARRLQMDKDQQIFRWDHQDMSNRIEVLLHMGLTID
jgi:hypothetical protein